MSYKSHFVAGMYFFKWQQPNHLDFPTIVREIQYLQSSAQSKLVAVFTIVPQDMPVPDDDFRKASATCMTQAAQYVEAFVAVLEGKGIKYSVMRSAASLMSTMSNLPSRTHVVSSVEEGLGRLGGRVTTPVPALVDKLRQQGIA